MRVSSVLIQVAHRVSRAYDFRQQGGLDMAEIHIEIGTHGTTLDLPAQIEDALLEHVRAQGVLLSDAITSQEEREGVSAIRSALVEEGVDNLISAVDSWFIDQEITPERTNDGVGNFHWEFDLP